MATSSSSSSAAAVVRNLLGASIGRPLDLVFGRLGAVNGRFFRDGWGDLGVVDLERDVSAMGRWPPEELRIDWRLLQRGKWEGVPYALFEGAYATPCVSRIYDALPVESRRGRVQLLVPDGPPSTSARDWGSSGGSSSSGSRLDGTGAPHVTSDVVRGAFGAGPASAASTASATHLFGGATRAAVLHLAATGDQGFARRLRLHGPLLAAGVAALVHEGPFYGARRPPQQRGAKLRAVSDLVALGWATIYESLCLLHWLERQGLAARGLCGLSMGGVHAAMAAGLCPRPLAVTPLLTPRSAAAAYCDGALAPLMAWRTLLELDRGGAAGEVERVVRAAAAPVSLLSAARYVRLQEDDEDEGARGDGRVHVGGSSASSSRSSSSSAAAGAALPSPSSPSAAAAAAAVGAWERLEAAQEAAHIAAASSSSSSSSSSAAPDADDPRAADAGGQADEAVAAVQAAAALAAASEAAAAEELLADDAGRLRPPVPPPPCAPASAAAVSSPSSSSPAAAASSAKRARSSSNSDTDDSDAAGDDGDGRPQLSAWRRRVRRWRGAAADVAGPLLPGAEPPPPPDTFRRLRHVLETFTDATRYPPPLRPDAAVLVAARHDGYVDLASAAALQQHWPGSELRLVSGGHVSAFLLHQEAFRAAIADSLDRLERGGGPGGGGERGGEGGGR